MRNLSAVISVAVAITILSATHAVAATDPADTVLSFSQAFAAGDTDTVIAHLAEGGQQFTLRSSHAGVNPENLTAGLVEYWSTIVPVLFASTTTYAREAKILNSHVEGDVATVWTQTSTASVRIGTDETVSNNFTEVYLLVKTADGWKIAAIADNRQTTKLSPGDMPDADASD